MESYMDWVNNHFTKANNGRYLEMYKLADGSIKEFLDNGFDTVWYHDDGNDLLRSCKKNTFHVRLQVVGEKKPSYSITADGISYFPVTRKMAKKLLRNGIGVEVFNG